MTELDQLRKDPTSHFGGVPRDITNLIFPLCRPVMGIPRRLPTLAGKEDWRPLSLSPHDELVLQSPDSGETVAVSLPSGRPVRSLAAPPCLRMWYLKTGEPIYLLKNSLFQFREETYLVQGGWGKPFQVLKGGLSAGSRQLTVDGWIDISSEGKMYVVGGPEVYEYDFFSATLRVIFSGYQSVWSAMIVKVSQDMVYYYCNNTLHTYDLKTDQAKEPVACPQFAGVLRMAIDPLTHLFYFYNKHGEIKQGDRVILDQTKESMKRFWISRSGYLILIYDREYQIYG